MLLSKLRYLSKKWISFKMLMFKPYIQKNIPQQHAEFIYIQIFSNMFYISLK